MHLCLILAALIFSSSANASSMLFVEAEEIYVYSGASAKYRPIAKISKGGSVEVDKETIRNAEGTFYKVLLSSKDGRKILGFINAGEKVRIEKGEDSEDFTKYESLSLAQTSIQSSFYALKDNNFLWALGYQKYPAPDLYVKGIFGQFLNRVTGSTVVGAEVGMDLVSFGHYSIYNFLGAGAVFISLKDSVFTGSRAINYYTQGGAGLKYNADEFAAINLSISQMAVLNPNNSFLSMSLGIGLEVGL